MGDPVVDVDEQLRILTAGTVHCIDTDELATLLATGRPLRVKFGIDPTASDIHLGHTVVLHKLRQFQDLGHLAVLIIGDFTARVGDPTGRSATRPPLTADEVAVHAQTYVDQVRAVLDFTPGRIELVHNADWLAPLDMADVLRLTGRTTVARIMERDDFSQRFRDGVPIALSELLYPLLQGADSVEVRADVELGGTDQLFNMLMGRQLQGAADMAAQVVMTLPLLEGLDGQKKMSKSLGNHVGIAEPATEQFGKLMSIPDELMPRYFALVTGWHPDRVAEVTAGLADGSLAPVAAKRLLGRTVVDTYHGAGAGEAAEAEFDRVFKAHAVPTDVPDRTVPGAEFPMRLARLLALAELVPSNKEGRRKIEQGGVRLAGERITDPDLEVDAAAVDGRLLQVGKRVWARILVG
ncbi:MAG: tyrosine--tRNA ligase [Acidimicrobiia bacterium]